MAKTRTGGDTGSIQFDRTFPGVGRIKKSSGTKKPAEFHRRNGILTKLYEASNLEVLQAFKDGKITIQQIVEADRANNPARSLDTLALTHRLLPAFKRALPQMGTAASTRDRYERAFDKLQRVTALNATSVVGDLERVDWPKLAALWTDSAADWNHIRRTVSRFLSIHLGDKYHPARRRIVARIPEKAETARTPDQSPELFLRLLGHMTLQEQACFMTVALTGMRIGEYLLADETWLRPETLAVAIGGVAGAKTGAGTVYLTREGYEVARLAIPCPMGPRPDGTRPINKTIVYGRMRRLWRRAQRKEKVSGLWLHDIRHLFGQTAADEGVPTAQTQAQLRHKDPRMTRRYEMPNEARRAAEAVARRLGMVPVLPDKKKRA